MILDGKAVASSIREEVKQKISKLTFQPHLVVIQLGKDDEGSNLYVKYKKKAAEEVGMKSSTFELPLNTSQEDLLSFISKMNEDDDVDGIPNASSRPYQHMGGN